ncbi:MAG TPA: AtpZ/AtpI family protein [Candidatus Binataceae bacterium]|nr:AtpZ/AtpI family protein [Candidatus Binataceae bacterium]
MAVVSPGKLARLAAIGWEFSGPIIAGTVIGHYCDQYFHTDPWITLVLFLLGVFAGFYRLIVDLQAAQKSMEE